MNQIQKETITLRGIAASEGIVAGKVFLIERERLVIPHKTLPPYMVEEEINRFLEALKKSKEQLTLIKEKVLNLKEREPLFIIDAHLMIMDDPMLVEETEENIRKLKINAEWALRKVLDQMVATFDKIEDPYLRERGRDIDTVGQRILRELVGDKEDLGLSKLEEPVIVVAHDLSPAETAQMTFHMVLGFATDLGSKTTHTAIVAKSLRIPAVVGLGQISHSVDHGDTVIVDGDEGLVIINPGEDTCQEYSRRKNHIEYVNRELKHYLDLPAETLDGFRLRLAANLEILEETKYIADSGAEGVGLYRTEYLYLNRPDLPTEQEHFENYKKLVLAVSPHPVTIRTLDLGGDKLSERLNVPEENNPAMGLRAIRLCFRSPEIFRAQLRGILRASAFGPVEVMFPLISSYQEVKKARQILEEVMVELDKEGIPYDKDLKVGIMIEVPSAALMADQLAREVDFFSIGTNDLIQYSLAVDRGNEAVSYMYDPLHPVILRLIRGVVWAAHDAGIEVQMCGEMAGDVFILPVLLGLGLDMLSMHTSVILKVKKILRSIKKIDADALAHELFRFKTPAEIREFMQQQINSKWREAYTFPEEEGSPADGFMCRG